MHEINFRLPSFSGFRFYDMEKDPGETVNEAGNPAFEDVPTCL